MLKYTSEKTVAEIMRRRDQIVLRRSRRIEQVLAGTSCLLAAVLLLAICILPGNRAQTPAETAFGSFLLPAEAGGYVLAAVLAFVLGVTITLLCTRKRIPPKMRERPKDPKNDENGGEQS